MKAFVTLALLGAASLACAQDPAATEHIPPDPPRTHVHDMSYDAMADMMGMDDREKFGEVSIDRLEWHSSTPSRLEWEASAWYGGDYDKLRLETEGARDDRGTHEARIEALWDRIVTPWWSTRLGVREDAGDGPSRSWAAFGVAGLAPGFVECTAMAYVGDGGRTALRLTSTRDFLITQRLKFAPEVELNAYGRDDPANEIGAGLSDMKLGLRLRYEIRREVAPYFGVRWERRVGASARFARAAGVDPAEVTALAGIRAWF